MERLIDRLVLLVICVAALAGSPIEPAVIGAFLCAVICVSVSEFLQRKIADYALGAIWCAGMVAVPQLSFFYPLIAYSFALRKTYIAAAVGLAAAVVFCPAGGLLPKALLIIGSGLSALLCYRSTAVADLKNRIGRLRDDSAEYAILLEEKNRDIIRNQNTEIYSATLKERNRIAREIHDNVGHMLSRAILMVGAIKSSEKEEAQNPMISDLETTLNIAMTNIRESVHDLRDEAINLRESLESLVGEFTFCRALLKYDGGDNIPSAVKYSIIAIVSEAMNNIIKHSNASLVNITFTEHPGLYQLVIEDNGKGSSAQNTNKIGDGRGMGLENMRGRVKALGGAISFRGDSGFRIFATVPKDIRKGTNT